MPKTRSFTLGPWSAGINNQTREYVIPKDALLDVVNMDFTDEGHLLSRRGFSNLVAIDNARSLENRGTKTMLAWEDKVGVVTDVSPLVTTTLRTGLNPLLPVAYAQAPGKENEVWWSNGVVSGRCSSSNTDSPWSPPAPAAISNVYTGAGSLSPGNYRLALTHSMTDGEESSASTIYSYDLATTAGLVVTLPAAAAGVTYFNIYCTEANGAVLQKYSTVAAATASVTIGTPPTGKVLADRAFLSELPPGDILAFFHGRLLSAKDDYIWYSNPYDFGHCNPSKNYIRVTGNITIMFPCENGIYVVADRAYWYAGTDIATAEPNEILPFGAVKGTGFTHPEANMFGWFSEFGFVLGDQQGHVSTPQTDEAKDIEHNFMAPQAVSGKTWVRKIGGVTHLVCSLDSTAYYDERASDAFKEVISRYEPDPTTVVMNLATGAASRYTNWFFNSFAQINNQYYGVDINGMCLLEGDSDNGTDIHTIVAFGRIGARTDNFKRLENVYISGKSAAPGLLTVTTSSGKQYTYKARSYSTTAKVTRYDPGKGARETWFDLVLHNENGADLEISSVKVLLADSPRMI